MTARMRLQQALDEALALGLIVPCLGRAEWISDRLADRTGVALECSPCPALTECAAHADELRPTWGVWAGHDRSPQPKKER